MSYKTNQAERDDAHARLLHALYPGARVYTLLRHVSAAGMTRRISVLYVERETGLIRSADRLVARLLGYRQHDRGGLVVTGCGMDMGFHIVYSLGSALWPDGTPEPHGTRNGSPDRVGGYALKHEWV